MISRSGNLWAGRPEAFVKGVVFAAAPRPSKTPGRATQGKGYYDLISLPMFVSDFLLPVLRRE